MIDLFPDIGDILLWFAGGGGGWLAHKRVSINYKERWKGAVNLLKEEKLQTEELVDTLPKPKSKPDNFAPAGDPSEFKFMTNQDRYKAEIARLQNGLPPKDTMLGCHNYSSICMERIKHGWDWDQELNGWAWRPTKTHRKLEAEQKRKVEKAYNDGYSEGIGKLRNLPTSFHKPRYDWDSYARRYRY